MSWNNVIPAQALVEPEKHVIVSELALGALLRKHRRSLGITQKQLADFCNLSHNGISQIETGAKSARFSTLLKLARFLGLALVLHQEEHLSTVLNEINLSAKKLKRTVELKRLDAYYRRTYGITLEDYEKILRLQKDACALCGRPQKETPARFVVDHDHATGQVRGLVCGPCNTHRIRNHTIESAKAVFEYLSKSEKRTQDK